MKKTIYPWINILLGCTILAAGFVFFINPYNIIPGGVYGASIVLHNLFPSIQVGTFGYMFDIPLLILSVVLLGATFSRFARSQAGVAYHSGCLGYTFYNEYAVAGGLSYAGSPGGT